MNGKLKLKNIAANRIEFTLEGRNGTSGDVTLSAFYQILQRVHRLLTNIEKKQTNGRSYTKFMIADLSHSSPARVVIEACPTNKKFDRSVAVMKGFDAVWDAAYKGRPLGEFDEPVLEDMRGIAGSVGKQIHSLMIGTVNDRYDINENVAKRIEAELTTAEVEHGTVEGTLEQINIHEGQNFFHIYFPAGAGKLKCHFSKALMDCATAAIGRKVSVTGQLHYRAKAFCPSEIYVENIELFPIDSELPDCDDIRGVAPDITGGKSSEAYIAEMRNAWD